MGINVSLMTKKRNEHPEWDWCRYAGDGDIPELIGRCEPETFRRSAEDEGLERPTKFAPMRAAIATWPNPDRLRQLCDILESQPEFWIHFGF